jgi:hypothetical protein
VRAALACGSVVASFGVERFSLERLQGLTRGEIEHRLRAFRDLVRLA